MSKQCYTGGNVLTVLSKCKLCLDSVQREGKVGFKRLVGLDEMDKELGWITARMDRMDRLGSRS